MAIAFGDDYHLDDIESGLTLPPRFIVRIDGDLTNWFGDFPV